MKEEAPQTEASYFSHGLRIAASPIRDILALDPSLPVFIDEIPIDRGAGFPRDRSGINSTTVSVRSHVAKSRLFTACAVLPAISRQMRRRLGQ
jgi:hypothetical protein